MTDRKAIEQRVAEEVLQVIRGIETDMMLPTSTEQVIGIMRSSSNLYRCVVWDTLLKYATELEEAKGWISVTPETMPTGEDCLLFCDGKDGNRAWMVVGYWNRLTKCWMVACRQQPGLPVTKWRPLPPSGE